MTAPVVLPAGTRCAGHPSRPAADRCPRCGRPRCGLDADRRPAGCRVCQAPSRPPAGPAEPALERLVRAALAAYAVAIAGGLVASEYVGATVFGYLGPVVVGVLCGAAGLRAAGSDGRHRLGSQVRGLSAGFALLGIGLGFLVEGSHRPLSTRADVLLPYACAVAGSLLWTRPPRAAQGRSSEA